MKRVLLIACIFIMISTFLVFHASAFAADEDTYDYTISNSKRYPIPKAYTYVRTIELIDNDIGSFDAVDDLFIDNKGRLYIADTGNNRIIISDLYGNNGFVVEEADGIPFSEPRGIFVDSEGAIFVADTGNSRIAHLNEQGQFVESFGTPKSELLGKDFIYSPSKVAVTDTGYIYSIKQQVLMRMDANNEFKGYVGSTKIPFSLTYLFIRLFASDEQLNKIRDPDPPSYNNFVLAPDGFIYAVSSDRADGAIKKLNSVGNNIYPVKSFGEAYNGLPSSFIDLTVSKQGIITVVDSTSGKIYQYDQNADLLAVFGGHGNKNGSFAYPKCIAEDDDGNMYIYDGTLNKIQVLAPTHFISLVHDALHTYSYGNYDAAEKCWREVLKISETYKLAYRGLGSWAYKMQDYEEAMRLYRIEDNKDGYSKAFTKNLYRLANQHFLIVVIALIAVLILAFVSVKLLSRLSRYCEKVFLARRETK